MDKELANFEFRTIPPFVMNRLAPVTFESVPVMISSEQERLIRSVLLLTSSDTDFAQKAADALRIILLGGVNSGIVPVITSLVPNQKGMGSQSFLFRVLGTGFDPTCVIYVNGNPAPTTFVSTTEVRTNLNLQNVTAPAVYPVVVRTNAGIVSNSLPFNVTAG